MKTLADAQCRKEIAERVGRIRADSQRQWGKMSAHQMVCHLADSFRGVMGERSLALTPTFGHGIIKWIALYAPLQWPHGLKTMPEVDQEIGGTKPAELKVIGETCCGYSRNLRASREVSRGSLIRCFWRCRRKTGCAGDICTWIIT